MAPDARDMPGRLLSFLREHAIPYELIHHRRDYTALETAHDTHTPGREFAKAVILKIDDAFALVVLSAAERVNLQRIRAVMDAQEVRLACEDEIERLCPDSEVGAEPPLGSLYGLRVLLNRTLARSERMTFNAGTHEDAVRISARDFERVAHPLVMQLAD
jgi:Ala-tRNA(Pro) deacylase